MRTVSTMLTVVGQLPAQRPGLVPYLPRAMGARTAGLVPLLHGGGKSAVGDSGLRKHTPRGQPAQGMEARGGSGTPAYSGFIAHMLPSG